MKTWALGTYHYVHTHPLWVHITTYPPIWRWDYIPTHLKTWPFDTYHYIPTHLIITLSGLILSAGDGEWKGTFDSQCQTWLISLNIRRFRDRHSSVIAVILVLTHPQLTSRIWNGLCQFALKYLLGTCILHVSNILILQNFMVDKLMIEDTDSVCEI